MAEASGVAWSNPTDSHSPVAPCAWRGEAPRAGRTPVREPRPHTGRRERGRRLSHMAAQRGAVLVTGASTGIGRATALRLDATGMRVFAGVRREQDASALREERPGITPLLLDVTDEGTLRDAVRAVEAEGGEAGLA